MKRLFCVLFFYVISLQSYSQLLANDSLSRDINVRALLFLQDFNKTCKFSSRADFVKFEKSFTNSSIQIFNDIMPDNNLEQKISIPDYVKKIKQYYADSGFIEIQIRPYELGPITQEEEYASLTVLASKFVNSQTKANLNYSDTFNIRIDLIYTFSTERILIANISSTEKRGKYLQLLPRYRGFLLNDTLENDTILVNGFEFKVNAEGFTQLKNIREEESLFIQPIKNLVLFKTYSLPDNIPIFKNKYDSKDKNIIKLNFWRLKMYAEFEFQTVFNGESPIKLASDTFDIKIRNKGSASNFITMNLIRRVNESGYFSIKLGAGVDVFSYTNYLFKNQSSYTAIDPNNETYFRINELSNILETNMLVYVTVPIGLEKGFTYGKNSFYVNANYYLSLNFATQNKLDANAQYSGYYQNSNETYTENGIYDFGAYNLQVRNRKLAVKPLISSYAFGFGYNRQLTKTSYFKLGIGYRKSLGFLFNENRLNLSENSMKVESFNNLNHQFQIQYINLACALIVKI